MIADQTIDGARDQGFAESAEENEFLDADAVVFADMKKNDQARERNVSGATLDL